MLISVKQEGSSMTINSEDYSYCNMCLSEYIDKCDCPTDKEKDLEKRLEIAIEALKYMGTFKNPDYISSTRGSMFEVARDALEKIK